MDKRIITTIVLALSLLAAACGGSDATSGSATADQTASPGPAATAVPEAAPEPDPTEVPEEEAPEPPPETVTEDAQAEESATEEPAPDESAPESTGTSDSAAPVGSANGCGAGTVAGTTGESFEFEGVERVFQQVVPASYDDSQPMPVVLNWHGLGSSGVEQVGFSDYSTLAESEGFIVIAPTGLPGSGDGRNSWELTPDQEPERDDLGFANALLDLVIDTMCVDETRVYTTGMSNGGYFSSVLACEMSERIAAAASVAALTRADDCEPTRTVPLIGFHGTDDLVVPYAGGGESSLAPGQIIPLFELKILDEYTEFAVAAGCDAEPVVEVSGEVTSFDFPNCTDDVAMTFYEIAGGGHTWPGSAISLALSETLGLGATTADINASQTSWDFFEQYSLPTP